MWVIVVLQSCTISHSFLQFHDLLVFAPYGWSPTLWGSTLHECLGRAAAPGGQQLPRYVLCLRAVN